MKRTVIARAEREPRGWIRKGLTGLGWAAAAAACIWAEAETPGVAGLAGAVVFTWKASTDLRKGSVR